MISKLNLAQVNLEHVEFCVILYANRKHRNKKLSRLEKELQTCHFQRALTCCKP